jgi:BirA family biotin operon repressor/biotin-[acetyl-CoA-carboxylase] ligase
MPHLHRAEAIGKERLMPREEIPMRDRIIDLLSEPGQDGWHSGEKLAADLGLTRTSLSKHLASMREEGDIIESATGPGHGYRLICPADPWAGHDVQKSLRTRILGQSEWIWLKDGAAINQTAVLEAMEDAPEGVVVVARRQDEGIDSTDFCWRNLPGTLTFAVILRVDWPADRLAEFTLLVQEACTAAVLDFDGPELECRKPNDLYLGDRKVGSILIQSMFHNDAMRWAVIGVGLNVNTPADAFPGHLAETASSLYAQTGRGFSIPGILRSLLEQLERRIG